MPPIYDATSGAQPLERDPNTRPPQVGDVVILNTISGRCPAVVTGVHAPTVVDLYVLSLYARPLGWEPGGGFAGDTGRMPVAQWAPSSWDALGTWSFRRADW